MKNTKTIFRLLNYIKAKYLYLALLILTSLGNTGTSIIMAALMSKAVENVLSEGGDEIQRILWFIVFIIPFGVGFSYLGRYLQSRLATKVRTGLMKDMVKHLLRITPDSMENMTSADIVTRFNQDIGNISGFYGNTFLNMVYQPVVFLAISLYLLRINWKLLLLSLIVYPLILYVNLCISKSIAKRNKETHEKMGEMASVLRQSIQGIVLLKVYHYGKKMFEKSREKVEEILKISLKIELRNSILTPLNEIIKNVPVAVCIVFGGHLTIRGEMSIGGFFSFLYLLDKLIKAISSFPASINSYMVSVKIWERMREFFHFPVEEIHQGQEVLHVRDDRILFNHVSFSYCDNAPVLENCHFAIDRGTKVALTGKSGCGKSTIFKLLCGFYPDYSGEILLFGNRIDKNNNRAVREMISIVSQEPFLFTGSIYDNLACVKEGCTCEEVEEAAKSADIHDFIMGLPNGYQTILGENACNLSGGQKQRISIARAILKNAEVVLFDEPTSSLDAESEAVILETVRNRLRKKTVLIVTHSHYFANRMDCVLKMKNGSIAG